MSEVFTKITLCYGPRGGQFWEEEALYLRLQISHVIIHRVTFRALKTNENSRWQNRLKLTRQGQK